MNKIYKHFNEAVADIPDGASVAMNNWGFPGGPQNLMLALREHGAKDLTIITENFVRIPFPEEIVVTPYILLPQMKKAISGYYAPGAKHALAPLSDEWIEIEKNLEIEVLGHGNFTERLRAAASGMGPFYSPVGVGTVVENGREKRTFDGKEYILLTPLKPDFAFVRADKADEYGNLVYNGICRTLNPVLAMAAKVTIVEVDELVEPGQLDPEAIITPAAFVDRIVVNPQGSRGTYKYTSEKLLDLFSIESIRTAFFAQAKQVVEEEEEN